MGTARFDLLADPDTEARPASDQFKRMVQGLTTERFHIVLHRSERDLPVYEIVVAKDGPKLTPSTGDPGGIPVVSYTPGWLSAGNAAVTDLATFMQRYVTDRPVVNHTSLTGKYDVSLRWTPDESTSPEAVPQAKGGALPLPGLSAALPGLSAAIQEQLGLKLRAVKAPAAVLVVDHVEMPSAN